MQALQWPVKQKTEGGRRKAEEAALSSAFRLLATSRSCPARIAFRAGPAAHQGQLPTLAARVALVAFQPSNLDLVLDRLRQQRRPRTVLVAIPVAGAMLR